ncbi:MAG TPA: LptA/OstA family protein [Thermoanaerobaculia bacterium]|nr:LptA/OstA family protein [Thermoanaerobaculia bacterium]
MASSGTGAVRLIRGMLLLVLLGGIAGVFALYLFGRAGRQELPPGSPASGGDAEGEQYDVQGDSFRHTVTEGSRVLFEIQGATYRAGVDGTLLLEDVSIQMDREEGRYRLAGQRATYDPGSDDARLEGEVVVEGPRGLVLRTSWLELREAGQLVVASRGSEYELGESFVGTSEHFRLDLAQDELLLSGGVTLATREAVSERSLLLAERIAYNRRARSVRARGHVRLLRPDARLASRRLTLDLDADTDDVRVIQAFQQVRGWWKMAGAGADPAPMAAGDPLAEDAAPAVRRYDLRGMKITVLLARETQEPEQIDIEGVRRAPAVLESVEPGVGRRVLRAVDIHAGFNRGVVGLATARGQVELVDLDAAGETARTATAGTAEALFDAAGELVRLQLDQQVELVEDEVTARAQHATVDDRQQRTDLSAEPWVEILSSQGTLLAPTVRYSHDTTWLEATGGVRAAMVVREQGSLGPLASGASSDPVRVESDQAVMRQSTGEFVFTGSARAWQEENRLTADQIRGNQGEDRLIASGQVATHWRSATAPGDDAVAGVQPVDISADHFDYSGTARQLVYEGSVVVRQAGRALRCEHLTVDLDETQDAERMDCDRSAVVEDPQLARKVTGTRALYYPKLGEVVILPPLRLEEPNRSIDSPQRLWYRFEDGVFELGPNAPDPERGG